ncbi:MAG: 30S ribosomal protein S3, small subunit ribosomal protein S3 [Candidatus Peregrinibacteria bacterium GW2011_GWC2_39_14]|nr:MAG: 30S ribosomal protein S3 [Candidatus Peregrinibacteria bacterium GW2011_GWA2_38_36]KKR06858.1 MAG: 30S ribosomal protein S3, small subunit ribosomal protein S3 [Candidatus Peregrinibacteria bacterium GW2011_GWC2_39_14]
MGQKVNPNIIRIGITKSWDSKWFATKKSYSTLLHKDIEVKKYLEKRLKENAISRIEILRSPTKVTLVIYTAKPGTIIGHQGEMIEELRAELEKKFNEKFGIEIKEIRQPATDARLIAESIAQQVEKRISYRRAAKMALEKAMDAGALGVKVYASGRLNGVEIARNELFIKGKLPLQTFRANIEYAYVPALTTYGIIGLKVWVYKGDIFKKDLEKLNQM